MNFSSYCFETHTHTSCIHIDDRSLSDNVVSMFLLLKSTRSFHKISPCDQANFASIKISEDKIASVNEEKITGPHLHSRAKIR